MKRIKKAQVEVTGHSKILTMKWGEVEKKDSINILKSLKNSI